ncbi:DUF1330 domain-containing protein [Pseudoalteromonas luteoviolacea]|uniref:DUF1330 domain-containing protein n=1 Tax=Pseudoalteromonas luteoviolacea TaxID=43657 RepID=UPI001B3623E5|nr:DUF1330 domain-containing protein [Pseudoalteromonas luteoviolacea]MBQ4838707.1 DUF1330 domain-containing protein [Pseudoalteromonas luteoviolacea]
MLNNKSAYLLFSFSQSENMKGFDTYARVADVILKKFGGELIIAGVNASSISTFEGNWPTETGLSMIQFPTRQHLEDFWHCTEYQEIIEMRTAILKPNFTIGFSNN